MASVPPGRLVLVADSHWLAGEAKRSRLLAGFPVDVIHYGLDTDVFAPLDRAAARRQLGIPADAKVVLFSAFVLSERRKGLALLREALEGLAETPGLRLLCFGKDAPAWNMRVPQQHLGYLAGETERARAYSAADVFVIPSLQEAFGQTALEAMACGVPAVGFRVGGIPDMVMSGKNGLLAPPRDVDALRDAIAQLLADDAARLAMGAAARATTTREFTIEAQARRYAKLYESLLQ
jgi:glycosyltransferase involved in cell wall biosynthesis